MTNIKTKALLRIFIIILFALFIGISMLFQKNEKQSETFEARIKKGEININTFNVNAQTPLMHAIERGEVENIKILLKLVF
jgi:ankyrin repeat protein